MATLTAILMLLGAYPLWRAWEAAQPTSLAHAVYWAVLAWSAWCAMLLSVALYPVAGLTVVRYLAVALTACGVVAVLGARRPHVGAWNFVVLGLLAVLLLPLAQGLGEPRLSLANILFLVGLLGLGVLNYLPTNLGLAALLLGVGAGVEWWDLATEGKSELAAQALPLGRLQVAMAPLVGWIALTTRSPASSEFDRLWRDFRDRHGLLWAQRVREQFNASANHAGWPVVLRWSGVRLQRGAALPEPEVQEAIVATLRALLKRFDPEPATPA